MGTFIGIILVIFGLNLFISGIADITKPVSPDRRAPSNQKNRFSAPVQAARLKEPQAGVPGAFARLRPGAAIRYRHPVNGDSRGKILGTIKYTELWQRRKAPSEPWVPTGNLFTAHWLDTGTLLYEWKGRLRLLDEIEPITDVQIKQHFAAPARRFGESDETARVNFAYPPGSWLILDIGKFSVRQTWGSGLRLNPNATGRFIHAEGGTGLEDRALVVEDYLEGYGGEDTLWRGWQLNWEALLNMSS